ncbi:MAG: hypothetical protein ACRDTF_12465, partial [Pseudonocardiaceae bacterium]
SVGHRRSGMVELTGADDDQRPVVVLRVTSAHDGLEHLVPEHLMTIANAGRYTGLCGRRVWAAVLTCPAGPPCPGCLAVRQVPEPDGRRNRRTNRRGVCARLITWLIPTRRRRPRHGSNPEAALAAPQPVHRSGSR